MKPIALLAVIANPLATIIVLAGVTTAAAALAEPTKLTVNQAFSVSIGIDQLNKGSTQILRDGVKETQAQIPFAFSPAVRVALAVDASRIADAIGPAQRALKSAREKLGGNGGELEAESRKALEVEAEKIGAAIVEIDLTSISQDDLALDKNPGVTAATIQALLPIFKK
jgi:hypothetical protein